MGKALFDRLAESYDAWYETPLGRKVDALEKELLFRFINPVQGAKVLDGGCGTGRLSLELARRGLSVTGVDLSAGMLEVARKRTGHRGNITLMQADMEKLPFPSFSYDLVVAVTALEFTPHPDTAVRELWRLVKPGGSMVVGVLNAWSPWAWHRGRRSRKVASVFAHARFFSPWKLKSLLARNTGETQFSWSSCVFIPPWSGSRLVRLAVPLERIARPLFRPLGALIVMRVDKRLVMRPVVETELRPGILTGVRARESQATQMRSE